MIDSEKEYELYQEANKNQNKSYLYKKCKNCHKEIFIGSNFCQNCGIKIQHE